MPPRLRWSAERSSQHKSVEVSPAVGGQSPETTTTCDGAVILARCVSSGAAARQR